MPYLCSVPLNPLRRAAQTLLRNPHRMHAAVEGILPPQRSGRLLWRLEEQHGRAELLVQSPARPALEHLVEQAGWPGNEQGSPRVADMAPIFGLIAPGRQFGFRVRVNPSYISHAPQAATASQRGKLDAAGRGVRLGHRTAQQQLAWFLDRTVGDQPLWGFTVGSDPEHAHVRVVAREHLRFRKGAGGPQVSLDVACFAGVLTVTDSERLKDVLVNGVGRAKAYGCGLLTLAPSGLGHVVEG